MPLLGWIKTRISELLVKSVYTAILIWHRCSLVTHKNNVFYKTGPRSWLVKILNDRWKFFSSIQIPSIQIPSIYLVDFTMQAIIRNERTGKQDLQMPNTAAAIYFHNTMSCALIREHEYIHLWILHISSDRLNFHFPFHWSNCRLIFHSGDCVGWAVSKFWEGGSLCTGKPCSFPFLQNNTGELAGM